MNPSMMKQYGIKKLEPSRMVEAIYAVVGQSKTHEIFTEYVAMEVWEEVEVNRKKCLAKEYKSLKRKQKESARKPI